MRPARCARQSVELASIAIFHHERAGAAPLSRFCMLPGRGVETGFPTLRVQMTPACVVQCYIAGSELLGWRTLDDQPASSGLAMSLSCRHSVDRRMGSESEVPTWANTPVHPDRTTMTGTGRHAPCGREPRGCAGGRTSRGCHSGFKSRRELAANRASSERRERARLMGSPR